MKSRLKYIGIFHKKFFDFCAFCLLTNVARHGIIGRPPTIAAAGIR